MKKEIKMEAITPYEGVFLELSNAGYARTWRQKVPGVGHVEAWIPMSGPRAVVLVQIFGDPLASVSVYKRVLTVEEAMVSLAD